MDEKQTRPTAEDWEKIIDNAEVRKIAGQMENDRDTKYPWIVYSRNSQNSITDLEPDQTLLAQTIIDFYGLHNEKGCDADIYDRDGNLCFEKKLSSMVTKYLIGTGNPWVKKALTSARRGIASIIIDMLPGLPEQIVAEDMQTVDVYEYDYLLFPYLARRKITILQGDSSAGKSCFYTLLMAAITTGTETCGLQAQAGRILIMTEDESGEAKLRLIESHGDERNVRILSRDKNPTLALETAAFNRAIAEYLPDLVIIDPVQKFIGDRDMNQAADVRRFTTKLTQYADEYNCAVLIVMHESKVSKGQMNKGNANTGSVDWGASCRIQIGCYVDPLDITGHRRYAILIKSNIADKQKTLEFKTCGSERGRNFVPHGEAVGLIDYTVADLWKAQHQAEIIENEKKNDFDFETDIYTKTILKIVDSNPDRAVFLSYSCFISAVETVCGYHDRDTNSKSVETFIARHIQKPMKQVYGIVIRTQEKKIPYEFQLADKTISPQHKQVRGITLEKVKRTTIALKKF